MYLEKEKRFIRINFITIISLFLLILAGGIVRSSGSGMGCPDWPKCFDQYIPPTHIDQLPVGYETKYTQKRLEKNEHFAKMLDQMGYSDLAFKIRKDESISIPEEFNPSKTWTEYINRLMGALTGVFLLLTFIRSIPYVKTAKRVFILSFLNLILVVFQAWLGSIVVSTNLLAWVITVHMLVAVLIIAIAIYTYYYARGLQGSYTTPNEVNLALKLWLGLALVLSVIQIVIGTEVREAIDAVVQLTPDLARNNWLSKLNDIYTYHKDLAFIIIILNVFIFFLVRKYYKSLYQYKIAITMLLLILLQILTGLILNYFGMPPFSQALHVLLSTMMFSAQFYLLLLLKPVQKI